MKNPNTNRKINSADMAKMSVFSCIATDFRCDNFATACVRNHVTCLIKMYEMSEIKLVKIHSYACNIAARHGALDCLAYLYDLGCHISTRTLECAIDSNSIECVRFCIRAMRMYKNIYCINTYKELPTFDNQNYLSRASTSEMYDYLERFQKPKTTTPRSFSAASE